MFNCFLNVFLHNRTNLIYLTDIFLLIMKQINKQNLHPKCFLKLMCLFLFILNSCAEDPERAIILKFLVNEKTIKVSDLEETKDIQIISNIEWIVETPDPWISIEKKENSIIIKIEQNSSQVNREGNIYLKEKNKTGLGDHIVIEQMQQQPTIVINSGTNFLSSNSESKEIELPIEANCEWAINLDANWIKTDIVNGTKETQSLKLTINENRQLPRHANLTFTYGNGQTLNFKIQQNAANTGFEDITHCFYATFGTMPSLYAGLHVLTHSKPSYFFYERQGTYDPEFFPNHVTIPITIGPNAVQSLMRDYMKNKILQINEKNPNAIFGVFIDDLRARIGYDWFVAQGIDSSRVKVTLLSDGTGSYNEFYKHFGNASTGQTAWKNIEKEVNNLKWDVTTTANKTTKSLPEFESWQWPWYMSSCPNYRYFLQNADLLTTENEYVKGEIKKMKAISMPPLEILNSLSNERKEIFYKMVKFDWNKLNNMLDQSPKPNLVIISTNPSLPIRPYIQETMNLYSKDYDIFYSAHPSDIYWYDYETRYPGLKLLPSPMPFEVFLWSFVDKIDAIGGSPSTVFLTVPIEKVKFMYASGPESMTKPLDKIFSDAIENVNWMAK